MSEKIESGDVVKLKSGGPRMTVSSVDQGDAFCYWFVDHEVRRNTFPLAVLTKSSDNSLV